MDKDNLQKDYYNDGDSTGPSRPGEIPDYSFRPSRRASVSMHSPPMIESVIVEGSGTVADMSAPKPIVDSEFVCKLQDPAEYCQ